MGLNKRLIDQVGASGADNFIFDTVLYTGTGSSNPITTLSFQPDFVWIASRNQYVHHPIYDIIRGATKGAKFSSQSISSTINGLMSFDPNGFTLNDAYSFPWTNVSGEPYVAWCWKASNSTDSNTNGTIASTVSASNGFSIFKYRGNGTSGATVGHGLSQAPELIIIGNEDANYDWSVYAQPIGPTYRLSINQTISKQFGSQYFANTSPTDSVFTIGTDNSVNSNGKDSFGYAFHSVDGVQKIGSYVGSNGAGNKQTIGFQPSFLMIKSHTHTDEWYILDDKRNPSDPRNIFAKANTLHPDTILSPTTYSVDFESDGFSFNSNYFNNSFNTYIYLAIA
jgi:hypothetical protein